MESPLGPLGLAGAKERLNSPRSFSSRRSSGSASSFDSCRDVIAAVTAAAVSSAEASGGQRKCNRYGWFLESEEAQNV